METIVQEIATAEAQAQQLREEATLQAQQLLAQAEQRATEIAKKAEEDRRAYKDKSLQQATDKAQQAYDESLQAVRTAEQERAEQILSGSASDVATEIVWRITGGSR